MRINLIEPVDLTDDHLIAEINEINMVAGCYETTCNSKIGLKLSKIPPKYVLGTGHVYFFYDKGQYLANRYDECSEEALKRDINITLPFKNTWWKMPTYICEHNMFQDYLPNLDAYKIIVERIIEKINLKPFYYSYTYKNKVYKIIAEKYCEYLRKKYIDNIFASNFTLTPLYFLNLNT